MHEIFPSIYLLISNAIPLPYSEHSRTKSHCLTPLPKVRLFCLLSLLMLKLVLPDLYSISIFIVVHNKVYYDLRKGISSLCIDEVNQMI